LRAARPGQPARRATGGHAAPARAQPARAPRRAARGARRTHGGAVDPAGHALPSAGHDAARARPRHLTGDGVDRKVTRLLPILLFAPCATQEHALREPNADDVAALRGDVAELLGRHHHTGAALDTARSAVLAAPHDPRLRAVLGTQLSRAGLYAEAETELRA